MVLECGMHSLLYGHRYVHTHIDPILFLRCESCHHDAQGYLFNSLEFCTSVKSLDFGDVLSNSFGKMTTHSTHIVKWKNVWVFKSESCYE